jgi:hypothetical protein
MRCRITLTDGAVGAGSKKYLIANQHGPNGDFALMSRALCKFQCLLHPTKIICIKVRHYALSSMKRDAKVCGKWVADAWPSTAK